MNGYVLRRAARMLILAATPLLGACAVVGLGDTPAATPGEESADAPPVSGFKTYDILYATDRQPTGGTNPQEFFGNKRGTMSYGVAAVTVPNLRPSVVSEKSAFGGGTGKYDPNKDFTIRRLDPLAPEAFFDRIRAATAGARPGDILVYVHGYLNGFKDALFRAAQLKHDLEFPGTVVAYSWPSQGTAAGYTLDEANVEWSAYHFRRFLRDLTARSGKARISVIAHSMGNRALAAALQDLACERNAGKLHQLILAAPDIDADVFRRDIVPVLRLTAERVTLYVSEDDKALKASRMVHGYERAGETRLVAPQIDTVDTTGLGAKWFELFHSYFAETRRVLQDIKRLLLNDAPPAARELKSRETPEGAYWAFN